MFDAINGMPLHPLFIHLPVIGIPLAVLLAALYVVPVTRRWARWPLVITVLGSTVAVFVSKESGEALERSLGIKPGNAVGDLIEQHSHLADQLFFIMIGLSVITVAAMFVRARPAAKDTAPPRRGLVVLSSLLVLAVSLVAAVWVARIGDLGARAAWNPTSTGLFPF